MKRINDNLSKLNAKDIKLYGTNINTINKNKIMITLTSKTANCNDSPLIEDNNNNNYNKSNNN